MDSGESVNLERVNREKTWRIHLVERRDSLTGWSTGVCVFFFPEEIFFCLSSAYTDTNQRGRNPLECVVLPKYHQRRLLLRHSPLLRHGTKWPDPSKTRFFLAAPLTVTTSDAFSFLLLLLQQPHHSFTLHLSLLVTGSEPRERKKCRHMLHSQFVLALERKKTTPLRLDSSSVKSSLISQWAGSSHFLEQWHRDGPQHSQGLVTTVRIFFWYRFFIVIR